MKIFEKNPIIRNARFFLAAAFFAVSFFAFAGSAYATTNISATVSNHWGWSDAIGWIDFYNTNSVNVTSPTLQGYASSSAGQLSFDCATSPNGNICSAQNGRYTVANDGLGNLSGWAWNDEYGWISFWCGNGGTGCGTSSYRVTLDSSGNFQGYAWNDAIGWIDFNCDNNSSCGTSNFEVQTSWVATSTTGTIDSAIFDTGVVAGAQLNSFTWQGSLPGGTAFAAQFAVSNSSSGPWTYTGSAGTTSTFWAAGNPGTETALTTYSQYANYRYFRYRLTLTSNLAQTATPRIDDFYVNWSP